MAGTVSPDSEIWRIISERVDAKRSTCGARLLDRGLFDRRDLAVLATGIIAA